MRKHGWNCRIKIKRFNKPCNPYKMFANVINRSWQTDTSLTKLATDVTLHSQQGYVHITRILWLGQTKRHYQKHSRKGTPADNAPVESFHSSLKSETFYHQIEPKGSRSIVIETVQNSIQFWNNTRIFTKLGNQFPVQYWESIA
ncbi:IS3 family transposase [Pediococcus cellicola]|uniref:IS3 family transposase n=1 Tax=Pediococcus cellicola TaxID=319652 RepID=UPI0036136DF1